MKYKFLSLDLKNVDAENRTITAVISDETLDRQGDIVIQDGIDFTEYKKNPVVLYNHNISGFGDSVPRLPIGKTLSVKTVGTQTEATIQFTTQEENPFGYQVGKLFESKTMRAWSIGINTLEEETINVDGRKANVLKKTELVEISATEVGANRNALSKAYKAGHITKDFYDSYNAHFHKTIDKENDNVNLSSMDSKQYDTLLEAVKSVATDMTAIKEWQESHGKKFDEFVAKSDEPEDEAETLTEEEELEAQKEGYEEAAKEAQKQDEEEPKENEDDTD